MNHAILVLNAGSSSLKFSVHAVQDPAVPLLARGQVDGIGTAPRFVARNARGTRLAEQSWASLSVEEDHRRALAAVLKWLEQDFGSLELAGVGHRVVHGGPRFADPAILDSEAVAYLKTLVSLAPLHQPHNLAPVRELARLRPGLVQVACFDTAFHRGHPAVADRYALPLEYHERHKLRRYGFHGLSYEYVSRRLLECDPAAARGRVVIAHLGNGASMCAVENGGSVDCSMGFSTLGGLPMGTRCGELDPGLVLHLLQAHGMAPDAVDELLSRHAGLLGISGISNDMRDLLASDAPEAAAAIDYFVYHVAGELARLAAAMCGLDALVFTAGIGEHAPTIRTRVCERTRWLGIRLDADANRAGGDERCISPQGNAPSVWVIATNEERMIALHTRQLLDGTKPMFIRSAD